MAEFVDGFFYKMAFLNVIIERRKEKNLFLGTKPERDKRKSIYCLRLFKEDVYVEVLKVSAKSNPNSVAGALAGVLREKGGAEIQAIGAGALNQAVKAIAIARGFVAPSGIDLVTIPAFTDIEIDGEERTAIKLIVEPR